MKLSFGHASGNRAVQFSIALALVFASTSLAELSGSSYDFSASGGTLTGQAANGLTKDNGTQNFAVCVGPNSDNCFSSGLYGSYSFADQSPTAATITFTFSGSTTFPADPFTITLGNFVTTDGSTVDDITYASGNLGDGDFSSETWNGTTATFNGTPNNELFVGDNGPIVFDVTLTPATTATPEPASLLLSGLGLAGLAFAGIRRKLKA